MALCPPSAQGLESQPPGPQCLSSSRVAVRAHLVIQEGYLKAEQTPPRWKQLWLAAVTTLSALHTHFWESAKI